MPLADPPREFDPRTQAPQGLFVPPTEIRVARLIERIVEPLTGDPFYQILYGEILKHVVLALLLIPASLLFKWLSRFFDLTKDWFDWIAFYALRMIEIGLIIFALYFVVLGLLDAAATSTLHRWRRWKVTKKSDWPPH